MRFVRVYWTKEPSVLGYGHTKGSSSKVSVDDVQDLIDMGFCYSPRWEEMKKVKPKEKPPVVEDTMVRKSRTRPVRREKED